MAGVTKPVRFDRRLTTGLDSGGVEEFATRWQASKTVRDTLTKVLTRELEDVIVSVDAPDFYTTPNLTERLAYESGRRNALRSAIKLLNQASSEES